MQIWQEAVSVLVALVLLAASLLHYCLHQPSLELCNDLSSPSVMAITVEVSTRHCIYYCTDKTLISRGSNETLYLLLHRQDTHQSR